MGNSNNRYLVQAIGKNGETFLTHCKDKQSLDKWIEEHEENLVMNELKIVDRNRHPLLRFFSFRK